MEISTQQAQELVDAAGQRVRELKEAWFPPTWFRALQTIAGGRSAAELEQAPTPGDVAAFLLTGEPHTPHADKPEQSFRIWRRYRSDFPRLLCLFEAMMATEGTLLLVDPLSDEAGTQAEWRVATATALRLLVARTDYQVAMICLDVAETRRRPEGS